MPKPSGLTVAAPETTWSLIPSFGYGVVGVRPEDARRVRLVLAEERLGLRAVGAGRRLEPVAGERVVARRRAPSRRARCVGRVASSPHAQVLRNHSVGSTSSVASSGPWFSTSIRISTSVGEAFA